MAPRARSKSQDGLQVASHTVQRNPLLVGQCRGVFVGASKPSKESEYVAAWLFLNDSTWFWKPLRFIVSPVNDHLRVHFGASIKSLGYLGRIIDISSQIGAFLRHYGHLGLSTRFGLSLYPGNSENHFGPILWSFGLSQGRVGPT